MIYFICWTVFIGALIAATIVTAVMGNKRSRPAPAMPQPEMDEPFEDEAMDIDQAVAESADDVSEPVGDDFAEFENEFS